MAFINSSCCWCWCNGVEELSWNTFGLLVLDTSPQLTRDVTSSAGSPMVSSSARFPLVFLPLVPLLLPSPPPPPPPYSFSMSVVPFMGPGRATASNFGPYEWIWDWAPYRTHSAPSMQANLAIQNLCQQFNNTDLLLLLLFFDHQVSEFMINSEPVLHEHRISIPHYSADMEWVWLRYINRNGSLGQTKRSYRIPHNTSISSK